MSFFDQLGKTVSTAAQETTEKAKNYAEIARLNSAIGDAEKKLSSSFSELGRMYYEKHQDNPEAEEQERIVEITQIYQQIRELKDQITQLKGLQQCPSCGAEVALSAAFCSSCGSKLPTPPAVTECPQCHTAVKPGDRFCYGCGYEFPSVGVTDASEDI